MGDVAEVSEAEALQQPVPIAADETATDFFISHSNSDYGLAHRISQQLEKVGYSTLPADFMPRFRLRLEMSKALTKAKHIMLTLSPSYLSLLRGQQDRAADFFRQNGRASPLMLWRRCVISDNWR